MNLSDELIRLIDAIVEKKITVGLLKTKTVMSAGDLGLTSMGDIRLQSGVGKKAYYNGVEILTGSGGGGITGSGTLGYIPRFTGASVIGNSHLIDDSSIITSTLDLLINKVAPEIRLQDTSVDKVKLYYVSNVHLRAEDSDLYLTALSLAKNVRVNVGGGDKLIISNTAMTAGIPLAMGGNAITDVPYLRTPDSVAMIIQYGTTAPSSKLMIGSGITVYSDIAFGGSYKLTGLAAGSVAGDSLRYEQLVGAYLPLSAGTESPLTGDLFTTNKKIYLRDAALTVRLTLGFSGNDGQIIGTNGSLILDNAGSLYLNTNGSPRLTVADALITSTVPLAMGGSKITGLGDPTLAQDAVTKAYFDANALTNPLHDDFNIHIVNAGIHLSNGAGTVSYGDLVTNQTTGAFFLSSIQGDLVLQAYDLTKLTIGNTLITSLVPLAMSGYKITGLAAATANGDALRYEQLVGAYLPLTGGTLTGDLTIEKGGPTLILNATDAVSNDVSFRRSGVTEGKVGSVPTATYLRSVAGNIELEVAVGYKVKIVVA